MILHKEYHPFKDGNKEIKFSVSFNKDSHNWATSQPKKIGYQVTATIVQRTKSEGGFSIESFGAFQGFNDCLLEVERQSSKRLQTALEVLKSRKEQYMKWFEERY